MLIHYDYVPEFISADSAEWANSCYNIFIPHSWTHLYGFISPAVGEWKEQWSIHSRGGGGEGVFVGYVMRLLTEF